MITSRGYRRLMHNGFRFGIHVQNGDEIRWRCTKSRRDKITGHRTNCYATIRTKLINGYEMYKDTNVIHDH